MNIVHPYVSPIQEKKINNEPDTIYYDVVIPYKPDSTGFSPAIYQAQLSQPIVYNPQEYFLAVVRFHVPGFNIPIFVPEIQPFPNVNQNLTTYSVTLEYNGNISPQTFVVFSSQNPNMNPGPLSATMPTAPKTPYYFQFEYTNFITQINVALAAAFAAIPAGAPPGSAAPYFIFDPVSERISLIAQESFYNLGPYGTVVANPIKVYSNFKLAPFLEGISSLGIGINTVDGRDFQYDIRNLNDSNWYRPPGPAFPAGAATLIQMEQEYPALLSWNSLQTVQLVSNLLPINKEYIPQYDPMKNGIVSSQGILADFIPLSELGPEARTAIDFVATGPWRFIHMYGNIPITRVDLTFYWTDQFGNQYLIDVPQNQIVTVKLMFIKKEYANSLDK